MQAFWGIVASNALMVTALAVAIALLGRAWKNPVALHLLWVFVLLKVLAPPVVTLPIALPATRPAPASAEPAVSRTVGDAPLAEGRTGAIESPAVGNAGPPIGAVPAVAERPAVPWLSVLAWGWIIGIGLFVCGHAYRIRRFVKLLRGPKALLPP